MSRNEPRGRRLLTRSDWIRAALDALTAGGVAAIAVDRLAKVLGATRGSFYWHFSDRAELIEAVLDEWERETTTSLVARLSAIADPVERLRALFREVYERPVDPAEIALAASTEPVVAPAFGRVTRARLDFLGRVFTDLGLSAEEAGRRAWLAYAFYIGHHQLSRNLASQGLRPAGFDGLVTLLAARPDAAG